jgi:hypothetical protein
MVLRACLIYAVLCAPAAAMERVRVSDDGHAFVLANSGKPFIPWGFNYGCTDKLIEECWGTDWPKIERDFRSMRSLGANVVRVHLQFGKFMDAPGKPNAAALDHLADLLKLAERTGLYLDLTGLACYRMADVPRWYDALSEHDRWSAQSKFWGAVAARCADSPAVFCYDLMNEPWASGGGRKPKQWYSGTQLGGFDFMQFINLDLNGRVREDIPPKWIATLRAAIREHDAHHLITVGLLPWVKGWGFLSGLVPAKVAPEVDFIAVHIYPEAGKVDEAITNLKRFAVGKPLVIEETFPLSCSADELRKFLLESRGIACGWIGHYSGRTIEQLSSPSTTHPASDAIWLGWLRMFKELGPMMTDLGMNPSR